MKKQSIVLSIIALLFLAGLSSCNSTKDKTKIKQEIEMREQAQQRFRDSVTEVLRLQQSRIDDLMKSERTKTEEYRKNASSDVDIVFDGQKGSTMKVSTPSGDINIEGSGSAKVRSASSVSELRELKERYEQTISRMQSDSIATRESLTMLDSQLMVARSSKETLEAKAKKTETANTWLWVALAVSVILNIVFVYGKVRKWFPTSVIP